MYRMKRPLLIWILPLLVLAACGTEETPTPGGIVAQVDCAAMDDSLLVTVYMTGEEVAAASQWCSCGGPGTCSAEFNGLGHGDYVLGIGRPDTTYRSTEGAEGFSQTLGYYSEAGLVGDSEEATTITLSEEQAMANVDVSVDPDGPTESEDGLVDDDTTAAMPGE